MDPSPGGSPSPPPAPWIPSLRGSCHLFLPRGPPGPLQRPIPPVSGAITSFAAGFVKIRWVRWSKLLIAVVTATQAGLVFLLSRTSSIWLCYAAFVLFRGSYQFLVPIAT